MGEVVIRPARPDDLPAAAELLDELNRLQAPWRVFAPRPRSLDEVLARYGAAATDPDAVALIAEADGTVAGMALGQIHRPSSLSDQRSLEISAFVVRESHRGGGIGTALATRLVGFARRRHVDRLDLKVFAQNVDAVGFWTGVGFRPRMIQMVAEVSAVDPGGSTS